MPLPKALADAKLPKDTDPKLITEGREQRGGRPHQVTKAAESCSKKWKYNLDNATDLYLAKSSSQNQLLSIVDAMDRGAELLRRQAARSRRLALEVIAENAKRLRS